MAGIRRTPAADGAIGMKAMLADMLGRDTAGHTPAVTVEGMLEAATTVATTSTMAAASTAPEASTVDMAVDVADHGSKM
jgi:hypothetical protein